ncbi:MAG: hypothetical protein N2053_08435 [Chitinispirillaceae bacterium]|nr:hypothetical protein [Chitinispirillaceae bacterium]
MKNLISDIFYIRPQINESADKLTFRGVFQRADTVNENGRVYPRKVLERAVNEFKKKVEEGRAVGTLEHPVDGRTKAFEISHRITNIWISESGEVFGEGIVLNTSRGKELRALLEGGVTIGISSRGYGTVKSVEKDGRTIQEVQDDYELETFDVVYDPSTPRAFISAFESRETKTESVKLEEFAASMTEATQRLLESKLEEFAEAMLKSFSEILSKSDDVRSLIALSAIYRIVQPLFSSEELVSESQELKRRIKELELELYKAQRVAESHNPETVKQIISDATSIQEVDRKIADYRKRQTLKENVQQPEGSRRKEIFSKLMGKTLLGG